MDEVSRVSCNLGISQTVMLYRCYWVYPWCDWGRRTFQQLLPRPSLVFWQLCRTMIIFSASDAFRSLQFQLQAWFSSFSIEIVIPDEAEAVESSKCSHYSVCRTEWFASHFVDYGSHRQCFLEATNSFVFFQIWSGPFQFGIDKCHWQWFWPSRSTWLAWSFEQWLIIQEIQPRKATMLFKQVRSLVLANRRNLTRLSDSEYLRPQTRLVSKHITGHSVHRQPVVIKNTIW